MRRLRRTVYGGHPKAHAQYETVTSHLAAGYVFHDPLQQGDLIRVSDLAARSQPEDRPEDESYDSRHDKQCMPKPSARCSGFLNWARSTWAARHGSGKASNIQEASGPGQTVSMTQSVVKGLP